MWARSEDSVRRARKALSHRHGRKLTVTTDRGALSAATLVVEAVAEEPAVKQELLPSLRGDARRAALLATTTSSLNVGQLADASGDAARFFGLHVFNPVAKMQLVELCFPARRGRAARALVRRPSARRSARPPSRCRTSPGSWSTGCCSRTCSTPCGCSSGPGMEPEQVDACMKLGASHPMGPLQLLDLVGHRRRRGDRRGAARGHRRPSHRPPGRIKEMVGDGRLGRKSGAGFYDYDKAGRTG